MSFRTSCEQCKVVAKQKTDAVIVLHGSVVLFRLQGARIMLSIEQIPSGCKAISYWLHDEILRCWIIWEHQAHQAMDHVARGPGEN